MASAAAGLRQLVQSYRYAYPSARAKALKSFLLTEVQLEKLLDAEDLAGASAVLRDSVYSSHIERRKNIVETEAGLKGHLAEDLSKIAGYLPGNAKTVIHEYLAKFEAENIRSVLTGVHAKLPSKRILQMIIPIYLNLEEGFYEKLASLKSVEDVVPMFEGTIYHAPLKEALGGYEKSGLLLHFETALNMLVYERTFNAISSFTGPDIESLEKMIGVEVDIANVKTLLRLKHEHVQAEEIMKYLIPHGYRLSPKVLEDLSRAVDIEEIITRLEKSYYHEPLSIAHRTFEKTKKDRRINMLERALDHFQLELGREFEKGYPLGIGPILGYILAKTQEVRRLITILKLKDEGFSKDEIREIMGDNNVS